jgi:hypothetical protein
VEGDKSFTEKERLLVGLIATRWQGHLLFSVDGAWFKAVGDDSDWEIGREEVDRLAPQQMDALAWKALIALSHTASLWPPLHRVAEDSLHETESFGSTMAPRSPGRRVPRASQEEGSWSQAKNQT